jgi:hypothetical protein
MEESMEHREDCKQCGVVQEVKVILATNRPPVEKLRAVELAVYRPTPTKRPVHLGPKGWPLLQGTAWETHNDLEMTRPGAATGAGSAGSRARS